MTQVIHIVVEDLDARNALASLLVTAGYAVRAHNCGISFLGELDGAAPACLIADLHLPDMSGVDLIKALKDRDHTVPAIVVTGDGNVSKAVEAMKAGAIDFLEKPFLDDRLLDAVKNACGATMRNHDEAISTVDMRTRLQILTTREHQVFEALAGGLSNKLIAHQLDISPRTVEIHRSNLMSKLRIKNLPQLVRMAISATADQD